MIVDFLAIAPFYLSMFFQIDLRVLRVFRLVRFLKLARYSPALQTLGKVVVNERHALSGAAIVMCGLLLFASTVMYFLERHVQPEVFGSVPAAAWWAVATLTTVGYGDVTPATDLGKFFGGLMMIFGLGMFALPIGIMATGFAQEINRREFVVTWSMVAKLPVFERLKAGTIATVMGVLKSQTFPAGGIVIREGEHVDAMYFVTAGEVDVFTKEGEHLMLEQGHSFGEAALVADNGASNYIRVAKRPCSAKNSHMWSRPKRLPGAISWCSNAMTSNSSVSGTRSLKRSCAARRRVTLRR